MLLDDLKLLESVSYYVDKDPATRGRIGYKDQDGISYSRRSRYKTLWAYFKERESANGDVDESMLRKNIYLIVNCGSFNYAAVPELYSSIICVTGTLQTLSKGQQNTLEEIYNVKRKTFMPSVYSNRQLEFSYNVKGPDGPFKVFKKDVFHMEIRNEIDCRRKNANPSVKLHRPVLVFFTDADALISFRTSQYMREIHNEVGEMNENLSATER